MLSTIRFPEFGFFLYPLARPLALAALFNRPRLRFDDAKPGIAALQGAGD